MHSKTPRVDLVTVYVTSGQPRSGKSASRSGQPLSKALALQLQLGTQEADTSAGLEKLLIELAQTNSSYSSQLASAIGEKLQDKSISLLHSRNTKPAKRQAKVVRYALLLI